MSLSLPPKLPDAIQPLADKLAEAESAHADAFDEVFRLEQSVADAERLDHEATTKALASGKPAPAAKHIAENTDKLSQARRILAARADLRDQAEAEMRRATLAAATSWQEAADVDLETMLETCREGIGRLADDFADLAQSVAIRRYAARLSDGAVPSYDIGPKLMTTLTDRHSGIVTVQKALDGLEGVLANIANPPKPSTPRTVGPLLDDDARWERGVGVASNPR